jgi:hypothetical protein
MGTLLGVHPALEARTREWIATRLQVPTMTLRTAARQWGTNWQTRGGAIRTVLQALPMDGSLHDRLLSAGALTGLWPSPQRWDAARRTWVRPRSRSTERPDADDPISRAPPPTKSPAV